MLKKVGKSLLFSLALCVSVTTLSGLPTGPVLRSGMVSPSLTNNLMLLKLTRTETKGNAVWGELYIDGKFICYTLENNTKKIPAGSYVIHKVKRGYRLEGVPGRTNINIEVGNYPFESLGCVFVGIKRTSDGVQGSKIALLRLIRAVSLPAQISIG